MLNDDHRRNLLGRADAIASSVHKAWTYLQVLKGMQEGATKDSENLLAHQIAFDSIYRAVFDALYAVIGTIADTTKNVESIHNLVKMARAYPIDQDARIAIKTALSKIEETDGSPLRRLRNWRHKHTAHHTLEAFTPEFYLENKLELAEVEQGISALDSALSDITYPILGCRYLLRPSTDKVASNCASLFTRYAA
ncbi:hypothetical protein ASD78_13675 [Lysobacter sp. Root667]|uniref:AbiU2 domain-containing protein n=1 Tax=Lysobacter sp. Root667 TaxID=1736581 RepID=UPI0006FD47DF|nr:hypothetical protein [Lysobacter sp. Root667]KRA74508.1 hypothetical protein ASD78_13675 [Lysobacter sp. Root667]